MRRIPTADSRGPAWSYTNDARVLVIFLGITLILLGLLAAVVAESPNDPDLARVADFLLGTAIFLLIFSTIVFLPRVLSRGAASYSLHVERQMDEVESAVRAAIQSSGRSARVEVRRSRLRRPPRTVRIDGMRTRIVLRPAPYRERRDEGTSWTEIVLAGLPSARDEDARDLRTRISANLTRA